MGEQPTLGEIYRLIQMLSEDISEIKMDVKAQNGRVSDQESRIAVLEDRSPGRAGAAMGAAVAVAIEVITRVFSNKP